MAFRTISKALLTPMQNPAVRAKTTFTRNYPLKEVWDPDSQTFN
jgi:hypothetical protein